MTINMLWFDNSEMSVRERIERAVTYFEKKYSVPARTVFVNPIMLEDNCGIDGLKVLSVGYVMPNNFLISSEFNEKR